MKRSDFIKKSTLGLAGIKPFYSFLSKDHDSNIMNKKGAEYDNVSGMEYRERMHHLNIARSGLSHGGMGAGSIELRKDGIFYNWSIFNNKPLFTGESFPFAEDSMLFFIVRYQKPGKPPRMKLLQVDRGDRMAAIRNQIYGFPWLSGVENIDYQARYPFTQMRFTDRDMPFNIIMEAWHPFIPHDQKNSALPITYFDFTIEPKDNEPVDVMLMCSMRNGVGYDVDQKFHKAIINNDSNSLYCTMTCTGMDKDHDSYGAQTLTSLSGDSMYYAGWNYRRPYYVDALWKGKLPNVNKAHNLTTKDSKTGKEIGSERCFSTVAVSRTLDPSQVIHHSFMVTWSFPNLYSRNKTKVGHYYSNFFNTAEEVARYGVKNRGKLYLKSRDFLSHLYQSTLDGFILDQINAHLNTFSSSSWFIEKGRFGIQEGLSAERSWGPVATMDVGLYGSVPIAALFPDLSKGIMRSYKELQTPDGKIAHGLAKGLVEIQDTSGRSYRRVDLPSEYVVQTLRDYFWTNDRDYLKEMWPSLKKAIHYILKDRDVTGNSMPYIHGTESSYDNFPMYGFSAYVVTLWLAAMNSAIEAAKVMKDREAEKEYRNILEKGKKIFKEKLWNGSYFRLYNNDHGDHKGKDDGCFTDQIIGQWVGHLSGLPELYPKEEVDQSLKSILKMSFESGFGLRNCSWPGDKWYHEIPKGVYVDQANTMWSGVELAFASFLMYEGYHNEAMQVFETVNERYRKNGFYFDHFEWGGHYFRPMSSWTLLNAVLGLNINQGTFTFSPKLDQKEMRILFAAPSGTAHFERQYVKDNQQISLKGLSGNIQMNRLRLSGFNNQNVNVMHNGKKLSVRTHYDAQNEMLTINFRNSIEITSGDQLTIM